MKLTSFKGKSSEEVAMLLAAAATFLLPSPTHAAQLSVAARQLLQEVGDSLHVNPFGENPNDVLVVGNWISNEISRRMLADSLESIRAWMGSDGILPASAYVLHVSNQLAGITEAEAKAALSEPDRIQHLLPGTFGKVHNAVSIIEKELLTPVPHRLLVIALRDGYKLTAVSAWRSDAETAGDTPLDSLRNFTDRFGLDVTIAGGTPRKFVLYETLVPRLGGYVQLAKVGLPPNRRGETVFIARETESHQVEVGMAFCIDIDQYQEFLAERKLPAAYA